MSKLESIKKKFGVSGNKTIVDNLTRIPKRDKGLNVPTTDVFKMNNTHQIDTLYMPDDDGYKFALVCVDLYSKHIGAYAMKVLNSKNALEGIKEIYKKSKYLKQPLRIEVDSGIEYQGEFRDYFLKNGIKFVVKPTGRHRGQAVVESYNGILAHYLNKRMLANEIAHQGLELVREWVEDLDDAIYLINENAKKKLKQGPKKDKRWKASHGGITPVCEGDSCNLLEEGTKVRIQLDEPRDIQGKKLHGKFRKGDIRWSQKIYTIKLISLRPNQPAMYVLDGINNASYTKNQLQVFDEKELPPPKEAIKTFPIEKVVDKKTKNKKVLYRIRWKGSKEDKDTWQEANTIPKHFIDDYEKSVKKK